MTILCLKVFQTAAKPYLTAQTFYLTSNILYHRPQNIRSNVRLVHIGNRRIRARLRQDFQHFLIPPRRILDQRIQLSI